MKEKDLQVEKGNFTRIINPLIERLVQVPFRGCELAVALFIIRKTYGYHKTQDQISISQFVEGVNRSRATIVKALKNLQLVNIAILVKKGNSKTSSNIYKINKYYNDWKLVNIAKLVKCRASTSIDGYRQLVKTAKHTKESKDNTKDIATPRVANLINCFKDISPTNYKKWFSNTTQRKSAENLLNLYPYEKLENLIVNFLPKINVQSFTPKDTKAFSPYELERNFDKIKAKVFELSKKVADKQSKVGIIQ